MKSINEMVASNNVPSLFDKHPRDAVQPMSKDLCEIFIKLTIDEYANGAKIMPSSDLEKEFQMGGSERLPFPLNVLVNRLEVHARDLQFNPNVVLFCSLLAGGSPGNAVMWAYSLVRETRKRKTAPINFKDLGELMPWGFPTEDYYQKVWEAQKVLTGSGTGNFLDTPYPYQPLPNGMYEPSMSPG